MWVLAAAALAAEVDLNTATAEELARLDVVGAVKVEAFLRWREAHGRCEKLEDLLAVPGFGAATIAAVRGRAHCGPEAPPASEGEPSNAPPIAMPVEVDVNRAPVEELMRLPGMVEARARAIVLDRERNGPYEACTDLVRVPGIGPATVANFGPTCVAVSD